MKRLLSGSALALVLACPALAATLTATPATYWAQLSAAKGETADVLLLQAGDYGDLNSWNQKKAAPGVTIQPAPGAVVTLSSIDASGSTNLTFTGFDVTMKPTTKYGLVGSGGQGVVFDRMKVHQADSANLIGVGFYVRDAGTVTIQNSEFYWSGIGGQVQDSSGVVIRGNEVHDVYLDAIDLAGTTNATVSSNHGHDLRRSGDDHADFIQLWATQNTPVPSGNVIANNRYERGSGDVTTATQGVFAEDQTNLKVIGNVLRGVMPNGISMARTKGSEIGGNLVQGYTDLGSRIIWRGASDGLNIHDNMAEAFVDYSADGANTNIAQTNNTLIQAAAGANDRAAYDVWQAKRGTVTPVPAQPPAVNPLQATVDGLNAQVAALKSQLAAANAKIAKAQADLK